LPGLAEIRQAPTGSAGGIQALDEKPCENILQIKFRGLQLNNNMMENKHK
jgi:hypothetical protein